MALDLCNCCDVGMVATAAGYCVPCRNAARDGRRCWHDEEVGQ